MAGLYTNTITHNSYFHAHKLPENTKGKLGSFATKIL